MFQMQPGRVLMKNSGWFFPSDFPHRVSSGMLGFLLFFDRLLIVMFFLSIEMSNAVNYRITGPSMGRHGRVDTIVGYL